MKKLVKALSITTLAVILTACSATTIRTDSAKRVDTTPTYQETQKYYLFGLIGENHINTTEICQGKSVKQMQSQTTFMNGLVEILTLGIYSPKTARVWCE